jgi:nitrogen fixation/metabolism regulation signal transduction histidine kinase
MAQPRAPGGARTRYLLILGIGLVAVAVFLLATASANTAVFAEYYTALLLVNGAVALGLAVLVGYQLLTLRRKLKAGIFGSKLTVRLVLLFALMALLPGALIYGVSVQFVAKSIESWFEGRLDRALDAGLNLGRGTLDTMLRDLTAKANAMALALSERPPAEHVSALNALREQAGVQEACAAARSHFPATSARDSRPTFRAPTRCGRCALSSRIARSSRRRNAGSSCACWYRSAR